MRTRLTLALTLALAACDDATTAPPLTADAASDVTADVALDSARDTSVDDALADLVTPVDRSAPDVSDVTVSDATQRDVTATDVTAADVTATDVTAPVDAMPPPGDGAPMPPRMCAVTAECVGACPMAMRACVCAPTMMGLRCLPSCVVTADCPPNPSGAALVCRMGLCLL